MPAWRIERQSSPTEESSRKSEVGSRKSEVRSGKLEVRSGKWEVRSLTMQHWLNRQKSEIQSSNFVKSEVWNLKYEVWSLKSEVGSRTSEARSRKTLLGFRNTQIEQNYDFYVFRGCTLQNNFFVLTWKQKRQYTCTAASLITTVTVHVIGRIWRH